MCVGGGGLGIERNIGINDKKKNASSTILSKSSDGRAGPPKVNVFFGPIGLFALYLKIEFYLKLLRFCIFQFPMKSQTEFAIF